MQLHKDDNFANLIPRRFFLDAIRNGLNRDITEGKERKRRLDCESKWIGNPQYGKFSMLMGFSRKCR